MRDRDVLLVEEAHPKLDGFEVLLGTAYRSHLNHTFLYNFAVLEPEAAFTLLLLNFREIRAKHLLLKLTCLLFGSEIVRFEPGSKFDGVVAVVDVCCLVAGILLALLALDLEGAMDFYYGRGILKQY